MLWSRHRSDAALEGIDTAYYLIHSMDGGEGFATRDRQAAENFRRAAERQGVKRIIYMGGLGGSTNLSRPSGQPSRGRSGSRRRSNRTR